MGYMYYDAEFTQLQRNATFISIGIKSSSGMSFYAEFNDYDHSQVNKWLLVNVISKLRYNDVDNFINKVHCNPCPYSAYSIDMKGTAEEVRIQLLDWLQHEWAADEKNQLKFFVDCYAHDWVLLIDLLTDGQTSMEMPEFIHYIPIDLCGALWARGYDPDINRVQFVGWDTDQYNTSQHNALYDAIIIQECFNRLYNETNLNTPE